MIKLRELRIGLLLTAVSLTLTLAAAEFLAYSYICYLVPDRSEAHDRGLYQFVLDENLGVSAPKSASYQATAYSCSGEPIYTASYTFDNFGRRKVETSKDAHSDKHLLIFGDSVSFSVGLNDADSFQSKLQLKLPDVEVYNYSLYSWAPQHTLALLEAEQLTTEVSQKKGDAFYNFIPEHFQRIGRSSTCSLPGYGPIYDFDNGALTRASPANSAQSAACSISNYFLHDLGNFYLSRLLRKALPIHTDPELIEQTAAMFKTSRDLYKKQFQGEFYVYINPLYGDKEEESLVELLRLLKLHQVPVIAPGYIPPSDAYLLPIDRHPNAAGAELMAENIAEHLRED